MSQEMKACTHVGSACNGGQSALPLHNPIHFTCNALSTARNPLHARRCLRCCCGSCGCLACGGRGKRGGQPLYITARWLTCLKVLAALLLAGVVGGCALGMAHMDRQLADAGVATLHDVQVGRHGRRAIGRWPVLNATCSAAHAASGAARPGPSCQPSPVLLLLLHLFAS